MAYVKNFFIVTFIVLFATAPFLLDDKFQQPPIHNNNDTATNYGELEELLKVAQVQEPSTTPMKEKKKNLPSRQLASIPPEEPVSEPLSIESRPEEVVAPNIEEEFQFKIPDFWIWLGTGMNLHYYQQDIPGVRGNSSFQSLERSQMMRAGFRTEDNWGIDAFYRESPGEVASSTSTTVRHGSYKWKTFSVEGFWGLNRELNIRLGLVHQSMPFLFLDPTNSIVTIESSSQSMISLGFGQEKVIGKKMRTETLIRYMHSIISSSPEESLKVNTRFAVEGSFGASYAIGKNTRIGLYLNTQWNNQSFNYNVNNRKLKGSQNMVNTGVELRVGLEF